MDKISVVDWSMVGISLASTIYGVYAGKPSIIIGNLLVQLAYGEYAASKNPTMNGPSLMERVLPSTAGALLFGFWAYHRKQNRLLLPTENSRARGRFPAATIR